ncbi:MAG: helix-turn-helix domain-containing protein [Nitrosopumilaceae archaeon]|jgi:sugar-specific transcriptional regulator TrmB
MKTKDQIYIEEEPLEDSFRILENSFTLLSKFGLSPNQSKVYLSLTKDGPRTASQLSKSLDIPRTEIYHLLKTLRRKGCVETINQKPMKFGPIMIENFLEKTIDIERNKIKNLEKILFTLKKFKAARYLPDDA